MTLDDADLVSCTVPGCGGVGVWTCRAALMGLAGAAGPQGCAGGVRVHEIGLCPVGVT